MSAPSRDRADRYLESIVKALPTERRDWGCAMRAELATIDSSSERRRFALSCTGVVVLQAMKVPAARRPLAVAGAVGLVLAAEIALAKAIGQTVPLVLVLTLLAWVGRRPGLFGPVRPDRVARVVRAGGYVVAILYLVTLVIGYSASGLFRPEPKLPVFALLLSLYVGVSLAMTACSSRFGSAGLAVGAGAALVAGSASFVLMPFERDAPRLAAGLPGHGSWLVLVAFGAPAAAALLTARCTRRADQAVMAALCASAFAALLVALLGLSAIALFPDRVPDIIGPVMTPGTSAAARQAANATEAFDPYAGLLLFGGLLTAILWVMARPPHRAATRGALLLLFGVPPILLGLSANHFPGATAIAVATAMVVIAALVATTRSAPVTSSL